MKTMEKKIYSRPTISEIKLDSEINLVMQSIGGSVDAGSTNVGMGLDESNETNGDIVSQFMNPLKWFR
jgi:hypothetical protein